MCNEEIAQAAKTDHAILQSQFLENIFSKVLGDFPILFADAPEGWLVFCVASFDSKLQTSVLCHDAQLRFVASRHFDAEICISMFLVIQHTESQVNMSL